MTRIYTHGKSTPVAPLLRRPAAQRGDAIDPSGRVQHPRRVREDAEEAEQLALSRMAEQPPEPTEQVPLVSPSGQEISVPMWAVEALHTALDLGYRPPANADVTELVAPPDGGPAVPIPGWIAQAIQFVAEAQPDEGAERPDDVPEGTDSEVAALARSWMRGVR